MASSQTTLPRAAPPDPAPENLWAIPRLQPYDIYGTIGGDEIDLGREQLPKGSYFDLHLGAGDDTAHGSKAGDRIDGEGGDDTLYGLVGDDSLYGGSGDDRLFGGDGDDFLFGGSGVDRLSGENGDDTVMGGAGDDFLNGNAGNDVLIGGPGMDLLDGGSGADRFVLAGDAADKIEDFSAAEGDVIDIAGVLAGMTSFTGSAASLAFSQGYVYLVQNGDHTEIKVDPNGGTHGAGDITVGTVLFTDVTELSASSFFV